MSDSSDKIDKPGVIDLLKTDPKQLTSYETEMVNTISNAKIKQESVENDTIQPIGLHDDLNSQDYEIAMDEAKKELVKKDAYNIIKNLEKDLLTVTDQNYCVVSWVGPSFKAKTEIYGFRIMGALKTLDKARKYAQALHNIDSTYDIGIMEMYLWCFGFPSDSDTILFQSGSMDVRAMEKERDDALNRFIVNHKTQLEKDKQLFEMRKRAIRKSKITKEGNGEDALIKEVPQGVPTKEMQIIHEKETEKWVSGVSGVSGVSSKDEEDEEDDFPLSNTLNSETGHKIPNQEWAVVSFVGYDGTNGRIPICIKGVYSSEEEANSRIKQLMHVDDTYDTVPMPLYKWVPCNPNLSSLKHVFKDSALNNLIETNEKQKEETLSFHQVRKKYEKPSEITDNNYGKPHIKEDDVHIQEKEFSASNVLNDIIEHDSEEIRLKGKTLCEEPIEKIEPEPFEESEPTIHFGYFNYVE